MCVQNLDVDKYLNKSAVTSLYVCGNMFRSLPVCGRIHDL